MLPAIHCSNDIKIHALLDFVCCASCQMFLQDHEFWHLPPLFIEMMLKPLECLRLVINLLPPSAGGFSGEVGGYNVDGPGLIWSDEDPEWKEKDIEPCGLNLVVMKAANITPPQQAHFAVSKWTQTCLYLRKVMCKPSFSKHPVNQASSYQSHT